MISFSGDGRLTSNDGRAIRNIMRGACKNIVLTAAFATCLGACVNVKAPDKPIVINLNINIKQEVVYRLDGDAKALINQEAEIF